MERMNPPAPLALALVLLVSCAPAATAPPQRVAALPVPASAAANPAAATTDAPAPVGDPVLVSQRLGVRSTLAEIDASGRLALVSSVDGIHVIDVEAGVTRGLLGGCANQAGFAPEGHAVVALCEATKTLRIWDLVGNKIQEVALARPPRRLDVPRAGRRVAVTGAGGVEVIELKSGALVSLETAPQREVKLTALAAGGRVATSDGATVLVFEASGQRVHEERFAVTPESLALSASGRWLAVAGASGVAITDLARPAERAPVTPCAGARQGDVAWTDDERHLVVACGARLPNLPARVALLSPDGVEEREIFRAGKSEDALGVLPRGDRLGVTSPALGAVVVDLAAFQELFRVPSPAPGRNAPLFSRDFERLLFHDGRELQHLAVVDRKGQAVGPTLVTTALAMRLDAAGSLLKLSIKARHAYLDPATGALLSSPPGEISPDGKTFFVITQAGFDLVDRATGAARHVDTGTDVGMGSGFSPHGDWVLYPVAIFDNNDGGYEHTLRLYDAHTGARGQTFSFGEKPGSFVFSDDDQLLALVTTRNCEAAPLCMAVSVIEARSGRRLATIRHPGEGIESVAFLPGGKHLIVDDRVHEVKSGRVAWKAPEGSAIVATFKDQGQALLSTGEDASVVDAATGKKARAIEALGRVLAASDDSGFLLAQRGAEIALWETATWTKKPTTLELPSKDAVVVLARGGRFAWFVDGANLTAHRFADGRVLGRALPGLDFDMTDEGVFDPTQTAPGALLARLGRDVETSPMGPSARAAVKRAHPGLFADFVASKPISPLP